MTISWRLMTHRVTVPIFTTNASFIRYNIPPRLPILCSSGAEIQDYIIVFYNRCCPCVPAQSTASHPVTGIVNNIKNAHGYSFVRERRLLYICDISSYGAAEGRHKLCTKEAVIVNTLCRCWRPVPYWWRRKRRTCRKVNHCACACSRVRHRN